jgi:glutathione S-transferase
MSNGIVLHHLEASRSVRVVWLLEELGVPYELKVYPRDQNTRLAQNEPFSEKGLAAIHPTGRAPLLQDDELSLAETGTIFRHLLEHYDSKSLYPKPSEKTQAAIDQNFWIDFAEASIMLHMIPLNTVIKTKADTTDGTSAQEKAIARGVYNDFKFIETSLEKNGGTLAGTKELGPADVSDDDFVHVPLPIISLLDFIVRQHLRRGLLC